MTQIHGRCRRNLACWVTLFMYSPQSYCYDSSIWELGSSLHQFILICRCLMGLWASPLVDQNYFILKKKLICTETWLLCPKLQIILKGTAFILPAGENSRWFNLFITAELCCSEINKLDWNEIGCFLINREMKNRWQIMKFIICTITSFSLESIDILELLSKIEFNFKTKESSTK